jgi:hypothetical protein
MGNGWPALPGLAVWEGPVAGHRYVVGADPAEGNPNSDESAACVLDAEIWAEVVELTGKIEPSTFATYIDQVGRWYNAADVMVERNNHGHLVIRDLQRLGSLRILDDRADAFALAIAAVAWKPAAAASSVVAQWNPLLEYDGGSW